MLYFSSDYMEGCHPNILRRLSEINMDKNPGYGTDAICESAKNKIRAACGKPDAEVYFLVGGTQTNAVVIKSMLRSMKALSQRRRDTLQCMKQVQSKPVDTRY